MVISEYIDQGGSLAICTVPGEVYNGRPEEEKCCVELDIDTEVEDVDLKDLEKEVEEENDDTDVEE
jgi:hypothetical protein